jgi:transcriptional regulator with GAF, ATPase, and Fis domain
MAVMKLKVEIDLSQPWYTWMQDLERKIIQDELDANGYSIAEAGRRFGLQRTTVQEKMRKLGIQTLTERNLRNGKSKKGS